VLGGLALLMLTAACKTDEGPPVASAVAAGREAICTATSATPAAPAAASQTAPGVRARRPASARPSDSARRPASTHRPPPRRSATNTAPISLFEKGREREISTATARARGLTVLDLSDDWVPRAFQDEGLPAALRNPYRPRFVDLANDRTDHAGRPLPPGVQNHLELYGIPSSLGVLRRRWLDDERNRACFARVDREALRRLDRSVHYRAGRRAARRYRRAARRWSAALTRLERRMARGPGAAARLRTVERTTRRAHRLAQTRLAAIRAAQSRLACEGLVRPAEPLTPGVVDWHHHRAMVRFERKHMIFGWGQIWGETRTALVRSPRENNHRTLLRALRERVANQLGVIEDGSVPASVPHAAEAGARDVVGRLTEALARALGVDTPAGAHRFFSQRPAAWFAHRRVAVRLPPLPAHHGGGGARAALQGQLQVVIDRGDVWYDFPYDEQGRPRSQPIARRPHLTLYLQREGRRLPLARWGTTIGGWRTEVHGGCHYWKYKASEVGPRQWKYLVAGPVWLPPPGTPPRDLVARQTEGGRVKLVPKQWEIGPGYLSAYGLVAALHTRTVRRKGKPVDEDGGIRTHGSADYMSILTRHSHGCHRLHNHLAVRLTSFLLRRLPHERLGPRPIRWRYSVQYQGQRFSFRRDHKGYYYRLDPPVPVTVTRGRIRGRARRPITRYVRKSGAAEPNPRCPPQPGLAVAPTERAAARPAPEAEDARAHPRPGRRRPAAARRDGHHATTEDP
jgi:hypothetical protein